FPACFQIGALRSQRHCFRSGKIVGKKGRKNHRKHEMTRKGGPAGLGVNVSQHGVFPEMVKSCKLPREIRNISVALRCKVIGKAESGKPMVRSPILADSV